MQVWVKIEIFVCQISCEAKEKKKSVVPVVAYIVSVIVLILLSTLVMRCWTCGGKKKQGESNKKGLLISNNQKFTYSELVSITNNFEMIIGEGGYGKVYLGTLKNGNQVAVKLNSPSSGQGLTEFETEVQLLTRFHHGNIVSLIGYCNEGIHKGLIYEYMAYGNLRQRLSATDANVLNWQKRLQIAIDAAQGLEYLHNGCKPPIIHRDIKTSNILLNERLQAKIADFGQSGEFSYTDPHSKSTVFVGTTTYRDPEYEKTRRLSKKSDVYSFGIVLLELITGQRELITEKSSHIIRWVRSNVPRGDIQNIVDQRLQGDFSTNSAWKAVEIAMSCVESTSTRRPDISHVVAELKECLAIEMAPERNSRRMVSSETGPSNSNEMATYART